MFVIWCRFDVTVTLLLIALLALCLRVVLLFGNVICLTLM